jgi:hypothetical protein
MTFNIEIESLKELEDYYGNIQKDMIRLLMEGIEETAIFMEKKASEYLDQRIYAQPKSEYYIRTGSMARGGTINKDQGGYEVMFSSVLGGADREYAKFVNMNSRVDRLNTLFFSDANDEAEEKLLSFIEHKFEQL